MTRPCPGISDRIYLRRNGIRARASYKVVADVFEAVIGALALDKNGGVEKVGR